MPSNFHPSISYAPTQLIASSELEEQKQPEYSGRLTAGDALFVTELAGKTITEWDDELDDELDDESTDGLELR